MKRAVSSQSPECVVDTVVLMYFFFVDRAELLLQLVGTPIAVPRIVFDPDDDNAPAAAKSELGRSVAYQHRLAVDPARQHDERVLASVRAERLTRAGEMYRTGELAVIDMTEDERRTLAKLTSPTGCRKFGLKFPLQAGEAACIAIAVHRNMTIATDDSDALKALKFFPRPPEYERIRKLLIRAATEGFVTRDEANRIHVEMRSSGFWDSRLPFP